MTSRHHFSGVLYVLVLAACSAPVTSDQRDAPAPAPTTLAGNWQVTAIDDRALADAATLRFRADAAEIWWEPRCAGVVRSYSIDDVRVRFGPAKPEGPPPPPGTPPPPVCAIGIPAGLGAAQTALDAATRVEHTPTNGVRLSGGGHSLTLASPSP